MDDLIDRLLNGRRLTKARAEDIKRRWASERGVEMPLSSAVLALAKRICSKSEFERLRKVLVTKPTRTLSGVAVVAVAAKPAMCPGRCLYCPRGAGAPQSYTGHEPAIMRALANDYDPFLQVKNRLAQLQAVGHSTEKCELIIMGGTFPAMDWDYQKWFVKRCFDGFNEGCASERAPTFPPARGVRQDGGLERSRTRRSEMEQGKSLVEAQRLNETAKNRVVGLTIETRPDWVFPERFLELGCTRVELGVQSVYDDVLKKVRRGHSVSDTADAVKRLKESGFKVLYQVMLGLPGSSLRRDVAMFRVLFSDQRFRPDMLKIYPMLVVKGSELYDLWRAGRYKPIDERYVTKVLEKVYEMCPKWVRIHRVQRDIPGDYIEAGPVRSNLRQELLSEWDRLGKQSKEIRFREAGQMWNRCGKLPENGQICIEKYKSSGDDEYFISVEDKKQNILLGFCRLRIAVCKKAFVRELHVYGETLPLGSKKVAVQHSGWGKALLVKAEELAMSQTKSASTSPGGKESSGGDAVWVISGVGAREYYRRLGYVEREGYMVKKL